MEYTKDIINITKIKEGFFIGDRIAGTNLDVVLQFKISHMINAAGNQILNLFETLGVRYLTLNWSENSSQKLLDSKDEIQNRIVSFIDNAILKGEGLLAYSVKGENRVCIIVIIYFMRKYFWSLKKCIEFLKVKKKKLNIPLYFLKQLTDYESRINTKLSKEWYNINNLKDKEELLIRNTHLNSLINTDNKRNNNNNNILDINRCFSKYNPKPHVSWGDNNNFYKYNNLIVNNDNQKDLILQKNIKDVFTHIKLKPKKKCIKVTNQFNRKFEKDNIINYYSNNYQNNNKISFINNDLNNNNNENNKNELFNLGLNMKIINKINQINNNFNNLNLPKQRSYSAGKKNKKNSNFKNNNNEEYNENNNYNNNQNFQYKNINKNFFIKFNNYFDIKDNENPKNFNKLTHKKIKRINNFQQKHLIRNESEIFNIKKKDYFYDEHKKRPSTFDNYQNKNIMNNSATIKQYINLDNNIVLNNSINKNKNSLKYYLDNNIIHQKKAKINNSFTKNSKKLDFFLEKKISKTQQSFNKIKQQVNAQKMQNKMNNSANNFYNYYNVMGQSFNNHNNNKFNNNIIKIPKYSNKMHNKIVNSILHENYNDMNNNKIKIQNDYINTYSSGNNNKKEKRSSTPSNLLPKNNNNDSYIDFLNYSKKNNLDNPNGITNNTLLNKINNNKSFNMSQKNQCKYIIYIYIIIINYSFGI